MRDTHRPPLQWKVPHEPTVWEMVRAVDPWRVAIAVLLIGGVCVGLAGACASVFWLADLLVGWVR